MIKPTTPQMQADIDDNLTVQLNEIQQEYKQMEEKLTHALETTSNK